MEKIKNWFFGLSIGWKKATIALGLIAFLISIGAMLIGSIIYEGGFKNPKDVGTVIFIIGVCVGTFFLLYPMFKKDLIGKNSPKLFKVMINFIIPCIVFFIISILYSSKIFEWMPLYTG
jgi:hypothetical protein